MQGLLDTIFPNTCLTCDMPVEEKGGLCGPCWHDTPFIAGTICDACGTPLPGSADGAAAFCDDCMVLARPWDRGRAALIYRGNARRLVLAMKHGDRPELARSAARWMMAVAGELVTPDTVLVPVPAHPVRLWARRFNQAALLAGEMARIAGADLKVDALIRSRNTQTQEGRSRDGRFANMDGAIRPHPHRSQSVSGRRVVVVDDVMTSGATLAAAVDACRQAGATRINVAVLARVAKDA